MKITLTSDDQAFVDQLLTSGPFDDTDQVIATALIALRSVCASQSHYRHCVETEIARRRFELDAIEL
jgi:hypothetical protein